MIETDAIRLYEVNNESQIIEMLSSDCGPCLFRGQPYDYSNYPLLPAAWRKGNEKFLLGLANNYADGYIHKVDGREEITDVVKRCLGEMVAVDEFCNLANSMGLYMPEVRPFLTSSEFPGSLLNHAIGLKEMFLPSFYRIQNEFHNGIPYLSLNTFICISLAKHHGIPTRFLDWSLNPFKALFFAIQSTKGDTPPALIKLKRIIQSNISLVNVVPYWTNDYLHRQEGVFTYTYPEHPDDSLVSIEERIKQKAKNGDLASKHFPVLEIYQINPLLLEKLKKLINYNHLEIQLMPAYSKCKDIIFSRQRLQE